MTAWSVAVSLARSPPVPPPVSDVSAFVRRIHWGSIAAAAVSLVGVIGDPHVAAFLPPTVSAAVVAAGIVLQAVTKPVVGAHTADVLSTGAKVQALATAPLTENADIAPEAATLLAASTLTI